MSIPPGGEPPHDGQPTRAELRAPDASTSARLERGANPHYRQLAAGELLGARFRILRFFARGGMGEVYEAEDLELQERVALKTVRPDVILDSRALDRFRSETQLARRVTHPNVCRTFDIGHDTLADGYDVTFVTMQLLEGETLAERLRREGRLAPAQALPLIEQMAAGLGAAHVEGIVHRDFKPANVILVSRKGALRAVVTDFGLAHSAEGVAAGAGEPLVGTPDYMAPEQVEGQETTPATDVYALGLVIYEMLTGVRPFEGDTPAKAALERLKSDPRPPRRHVREIDPAWEAVVLRCLERDPQRRFASAPDVARALSGAQPLPAVPRARGVAAIALAVLLGAGVAAYVASTRQAPGPAASAPQARRVVAVLGFKNLSERPDSAWLSTALSEMLSSELAAADGLRVIPGESVARTKLDLGLPDADSFARDTLLHVRRNLGSDLVVLGSYLALPGEDEAPIRLDVRAQDAAAGETIASVSESGPQAELLQLVARAGEALRGRLGVSVPPAAAAAAHASAPTSLQAARLYASGVARLRLFDALGARDLLARAVEADPAAPLLHSALAKAWEGLGYDARARDEARRAFELSAKLPREERLLVEGRACEAARHWERAIEVYQTLFAFAPDDLEYGLALAGAQASGGKGREAGATIAALRQLAAPFSDDPRIDIAESAAAESLGDFKRMARAAERAAAVASARGARLLLARARSVAAAAFGQLGDYAEAMAAGQEARRVYAESGDRGGEARVLNHLGIARYRQGQLDAARELYEQSLQVARALGDQRGTSAALNNLAIIFDTQGELARAASLYEEGLAIDREIGNPRPVAIKLLNIGGVRVAEGRAAAARPLLEESLAIRREIGDRGGEAWVLLALGSAAYSLGSLGEAEGLLRRALPIAREAGERGLAASVASRLGEVLLAQGRTEAAQAELLAALREREALGGKLDAAQTRLCLSRLALQQGRASEAETLARGALLVFEQEKAAHDVALARAVLAQALIARGRGSAAGDALAPATAALGTLQHTRPRLAVILAGAGVAAAGGDFAGAALALEAARVEASGLGLAGEELEARLALGELGLQRGDAAARGLLFELEREATARGFGSIGRRAGAAAH